MARILITPHLRSIDLTSGPSLQQQQQQTHRQPLQEKLTMAKKNKNKAAARASSPSTKSTTSSSSTTTLTGAPTTTTTTTTSSSSSSTTKTSQTVCTECGQTGHSQPECADISAAAAIAADDPSNIATLAYAAKHGRDTCTINGKVFMVEKGSTDPNYKEPAFILSSGSRFVYEIYIAKQNLQGYEVILGSGGDSNWVSEEIFKSIWKDYPTIIKSFEKMTEKEGFKAGTLLNRGKTLPVVGKTVLRIGLDKSDRDLEEDVPFFIVKDYLFDFTLGSQWLFSRGEDNFQLSWETKTFVRKLENGKFVRMHPKADELVKERDTHISASMNLITPEETSAE